ncbi:MAG: hypothetical protein ABW022_02405 [Actinoplanes sp.]
MPTRNSRLRRSAAAAALTLSIGVAVNVAGSPPAAAEPPALCGGFISSDGHDAWWRNCTSRTVKKAAVKGGKDWCGSIPPGQTMYWHLPIFKFSGFRDC